MIQRALSKKLKQVIKQFPVVAIMGPRQSGKTTLVKMTFPDMVYVSLEDLDNRSFAIEDPRGFLATYNKGAILDEAQRAPGLFSYLQTYLDEKEIPGQFILTGSQNFLLHEKVSQSLAGRVCLLKLLPLSLKELNNNNYPLSDFETSIFNGFYPRVLAKNISPLDWYPSYIQTYVERDVRLIKNITDFDRFQTFLKMCAGRIGQLLNLSSLANDCGITHNTAKSWLGVLEMSFIIFTLRPHHRNFNKRMVKMPKLYFYDTGLACSLLGIQNPMQLTTHHLKGGLFEAMIISELAKEKLNQGHTPNLFFWRDKTGHEIDCLIEQGIELSAVEIKSGKTITSDFFKELKYWQRLSNTHPASTFLVYGGTEQQVRQHAMVIGWNQLSQITRRTIVQTTNHN